MIIFDHETEVELDVQSDVEVQEVVVETETIRDVEIVDVLHPVHSPLEVSAGPETVSTPEQSEPTQTNVVSLFGRGRRSADMPEIVVEPEVLDVPVVETVEAVVAPARKKDGVEVDDIFAKLRAGTTADVASKSTQTVEAVKPEKETAKKPVEKKAKAKPPTPVVDPAKFEARNEALAPVVVATARKLKRVLKTL